MNRETIGMSFLSIGRIFRQIGGEKSLWPVVFPKRKKECVKTHSFFYLDVPEIPKNPCHSPDFDVLVMIQ